MILVNFNTLHNDSFVTQSSRSAIYVLQEKLHSRSATTTDAYNTSSWCNCSLYSKKNNNKKIRVSLFQTGYKRPRRRNYDVAVIVWYYYIPAMIFTLVLTSTYQFNPFHNWARMLKNKQTRILKLFFLYKMKKIGLMRSNAPKTIQFICKYVIITDISPPIYSVVSYSKC